MSSAVAWVAGSSPAQRVQRLVELERRVNALHAEQLELIAAMAAADEASADVLARDWTVEEIAAALRLSPGAARNRVAMARFAVAAPGLVQALRHGRVSLLHVLAAERELRHCTAEQVAVVVARVVERASGQTVGEFAGAVRRAVLTVAADDAAARRARARADRCVRVRPVADGMCEWWALLPAEQSLAMAARLDAAARSVQPGDPRTVAQRRADALVQCVLGGAATPPAGLGPQVFVAATTLAGLDEQPAELAGYGPIPAAIARQLAVDPTGCWRGVLTDQRGVLLDVGRRAYRPPASLERFVRLRDQRCRFPGCTRPAHTTDLDHIHAWADGGTTREANLHALCPRHHTLKHNSTWQVKRRPDGTTVWTSATGRTYHVPPPTYPSTVETDPDPPK